MKKLAAVVAHFGDAGILSPPFARLVQHVVAAVEHVVVVSTSPLPQTGILTSSSITVIERPNIGYDFYSYRVGLTALGDLAQYDGVFLVNSSFLVIDDTRFSACLDEMIARGGERHAVGIVESQQVHHHLQSFLIYLGREVLSTTWFPSWRDSIEPKNCKGDVIAAYELGLSDLLVRHGVSLITLLTLSPSQRLKAARAALRSKFTTKPILRAVASMMTGRFRSFNPSHVAAEPIAKRCGIVKIELLASNPLKLNLSWLRECTAPHIQREVDEFIEQRRKSSNPPPLRLASTVANGATSPASVAVVVHAFYTDLIPILREHLLHFTEPFDLYVTTPHEADAPLILGQLGDVTPYITVALAENRGRDIGPFVSLLRAGALNRYQAVLKLHLKKSSYSARGTEWREMLFRELCGDSCTINEALCTLRNGEVGILGPHSQFLSHPRFWGRNERMVREIQEASGASPDANIPLGFFAGSMFWFNPKALTAISSLPESVVQFEAESGAQDGTRAHAFERVFTSLAHQAGYRVSSLQLHGEEISGRPENAMHTVPVL